MKTNDTPLPIMNMNKGELNDFFCVCAGLDALEDYIEKHPARLRAIPGGYRDARMLLSVMDKLAKNIRQTIPPEKRRGADLTSRNMKYKLSLGPRAAKEKDAMIMSLDTLDALVLSAHEGKCKICMRDTCAGCALCKALDNVIASDRDGRTWGAINIIEVM